MRVDARSRRRHRSFDGTTVGLTGAFDSLDTTGRSVVAVSDGGAMLQAQRDARGGWRLRHISTGGNNGAMTSRRSEVVDETVARATLAAYLAEDGSWDSMVQMRRGLGSRSPSLLIALTFVVAVGIALAVMFSTGTLQRSDLRYTPNLIVGVVLIASVVVYIDLFMRKIRTRIAGVLGRRMGVTIVESSHAGWFSRRGMWEAEGGGTLSTLAATAADFVVIVIGLVVPVAAFATAVVVLTERFLP